MSDTIVMDVVTASGIAQYGCNGEVEDREKVKAAFKEAMAGGRGLASVVDSPGHATQVKTFKEVEEIERNRVKSGEGPLPVEVRVHHALVGG